MAPRYALSMLLSPHSSKPVRLIQADIDHALIGWESFNRGPDTEGLAETFEVLDRYQESSIFGLSTARSIPETKRLAPLLKGFPVDFVAVGGGEQLYINEQKLPAEQFLASLSPEQQDREWAGVVRDEGWDAAKVSSLVKECLQDKGYQPSEQFEAPYDSLENWKNSEASTVSFYPGQAGLHVSGESRGQVRNDLSQELSRKFDQNAVSFAHNDFEWEELGASVAWFRPQGVDKEKLLTHLVQRWPSIERVYTAGDSLSDCIQPDEFAGRANHRVVAGTKRKVLDAMEGMPRTEFCPSGRIGSGLQKLIVQ